MGILSSLGHGSRLARAAFVFAREGHSSASIRLCCRRLRLPLAFANLIAKRDGDGLAGLSRAIDRLGPSYVKLGQFLSTRPDIVGGKVAIELERLQDRVAPMSREMAVAIIEASFGVKIKSLFESFGEPVAAASIAQVHRAGVFGTTASGVVKSTIASASASVATSSCPASRARGPRIAPTFPISGEGGYSR